MSRALSADFIAEKNKLFSRPFPSAVFHFGGAVGDIYLSGHNALIAGNLHTGCVQSWGEIGALSKLRDGEFSTGSMRLRIINHPLFGSPLKRFSDLWAGIGIEGIEVDVYLNFLKTDAPGTILQQLAFAGVMRPHWYTPDICEIELAPVAEKYLPFEISFPIDQTDFPNAYADDIGKRANVIAGAVKNVKCHLVATGLRSTLRATMATGDTAVPIHDEFHDGLPSTGTIQIGNEKIAYGGKGGSAGSRTLTSLTRGSGSTPIESHNKDDTIIQVVTSWIFLVAGHACKAIDRVYVRRGDKKIPLAASQYTVNLTNTTLVSGKTLTTLTFTAPPLIAEKDYVSIGASSAEATWEDAGSDETITITPPTPWPNGVAETENIAAPTQAKTKSSGSYIKRLTCQYVSGGQSGNYNVYVENIFSGSGQAPDYKVIAGQANVGATPHQRVEPEHWSLRLSYVNESGNQLANPAAIVVNVNAKSVSYAVSAASSLATTSTADNPIGDIYVDVQGVADDGSGTYTGSANALIEKPADLLHYLARVLGGIPAGRVDAASFTAARADAPASHKLSGVLTDRASELKTLFLALGMQSRIRIDWPVDKLTARYLKSSYGAAVKTLSRDQVRASKSAEGIKTSLRLTRTAVEDLVNKIHLYYGRDWSMGRGKEAFTKVSKTSDATSITKYGTREQEQRFLFDFIAAADSSMADDLRDFWLGRLKEPARVAEMEVFLDQFEILPGDLVALDYLVGAAEKFDGLAGVNKFLVEELRLALSSAAPIARLVCREVS